MARPIKKGLNYYPLDVDFLQDIKVRKIMRACGIQSVAILISLLSSIYRDEGYYVGWDSDMSFLVADEVGASEGAVLEVVNKAIQIDFFNKDIFNEYKVLTSKGIQKRFIDAINRRININLISEYLLVDLVNEYSNLINVNINSINGDRSTQRKEKKSKVKKSKEEDIGSAPKLENLQKHKYGEYKNVLLSDEELDKLKAEFPNDWQQRVERVSEYSASTGKTYKNYLATIRNWAKKEGNYGKPKGNNGTNSNTGGASEESLRLERIAKEQGLIKPDGSVEPVGEVDF